MGIVVAGKHRRKAVKPSWKRIDEKARNELVIMGHSHKWAAPLPVFWNEDLGEFLIENVNVSGFAHKVGFMIEPSAGQPTHWDYCPLPPPSTT